MMTKDERGLIAESGFVFLALVHHFVIWRPINPQLRYDFIVESDNSQLKVQVKSSWKEGTAYRVDLTKKRRCLDGLVTKKYQVGDFDLLAVFNPDKLDFWLIPASIALPRTTIWCRDTQARCTQGFDTVPYWKNWDIFGV